MSRAPLGLVVLSLAALWLAALASGCTAILSYPPTPPEDGDEACHDHRDNDLDGRIDCADDSCARCVARPLVVCPDGWASTPVGDDAGTMSCTLPPDAVVAGCPTEAPAGVTPVPATPGAIGDYVAAHQVQPYLPAGPPIDVWIAPGRHLEDTIDVRGHVFLHGLCDGTTLPRLEAAAGHDSPVAVDSGRLEIEFVEIALGTGTAPAMGRGGGMDLRHARVVALGDPDATYLVLEPSMTATFDFVEAQVDVTTDAARLTATDSILAGVRGVASRVELTRVEMGSHMAIAGAVSTLVATSLFSHCGGISAREGAALTLSEAVVSHPFGNAGLLVAGSEGGAHGSASLHDVVVASSPRCTENPDSPSASLAFVTTDVALEVTSVIAPGWLALSLGGGSSGTAVDTSWVGSLALEDADVSFARAHVTGVDDVAVRVGTQGSLDLDQVYVDAIPTTPREPGTCVPTSAGLSVAGHATVRRSAFSHVSGCGVVVLPTGDLTIRGDVRVEDAWTGLCAVGRYDGEALAAPLSAVGVDQAFTEPAELCLEPSCLPIACDPPTEMRCGNDFDDDFDALIDCADPDCAGDAFCRLDSEAGRCTNGIDDDRDGTMDCADAECATTPECLVPPTPEVGQCDDGVDDDQDGFVDCADPDCSCDPICTQGSEPCPGPDLGSALGVLVDSAMLPAQRIWCIDGPPSCTPAAAGTSATYLWTAPADGFYTFSTGAGTSAGFDTVLQIVDLGCGATELACDDDSAGMAFSRASVRLVAGEQVLVRIRAFFVGWSGTYSLRVDPG